MNAEKADLWMARARSIWGIFASPLRSLQASLALMEGQMGDLREEYENSLSSSGLVLRASCDPKKHLSGLLHWYHTIPALLSATLNAFGRRTKRVKYLRIKKLLVSVVNSPIQLSMGYN